MPMAGMHHKEEIMLYKNGEGYPDYVAGEAIKAADRPPENVILFRKMIKAMCTIFHVRILGKITLVDENGRSW